MKVLHVIPAVARRYGGPSTAVCAMASHLAAQPDIELEIATTNADGSAGTILPNDIAFDVPVHLFPRTFSERWKYSRPLGAWLDRHVAEFELVHIHGVWSYAGTAAAAAARRRGVPYIVRPAGMLSDYSLHHRAWLKRLYWWGVERQTILGASALHATSTGERDDLRKVRPDARVEMIPNGVEDSAWTSLQNDSLRTRTSEDQPTECVVSMSRMHPKKGFADLLLPAISLMRTQPLVLLGGDRDTHAPAYIDLVRSEIARLGLSNRVHMLGDVVGDSRWKLLDRADVFVLASHSENFGIVIAEAMARARPVVVTDGVQISPQVRSAGAGIVVAPTPRELAAALDQLLSDRELGRSMGLAGQRYCREHFSWPAIACQIRALYDSILRCSGIPPAVAESADRANALC